MAFNFNWHPLTADSSFYSRAKDLLTAALNKSPKPPIIVSDILVTELNLGTTPPELEILEIGDLADDRFRGIFKMQYSGDAFLTLQTKVQANPLNTYLSTAPSFTNPMPLAAASSLTIPLQITLSQFRLSGFVILVFSKAKGVTLVFRNDPLESLVVSSTFDSIPFIKDYLQQEIEKQLRNLFQDELPAIIHRLSLQWCGNEYDSASSNTTKSPTLPHRVVQDPDHSLSARSSFENLGENTEGTASPFTYGHDPESDTLSSKNLLRLATLMDSQQTLSLFTPPIRDAIYRAWATTGDRSDPTSTPSTGPTTTTYSFENTPQRPGLVSANSTSSYMGASTMMGANGRPIIRPNPHGRKKKTRVVNLRRTKTSPTEDDSLSIADTNVSDSSLLPESSSQTSYIDEDTGDVKSPPITPPRDSLRASLRSPKGRPAFYEDVEGDPFSEVPDILVEQDLATEPTHLAADKSRAARSRSRLPNMQTMPERPVPSPARSFTSPTRLFAGSRENSSFFSPATTLDFSSVRTNAKGSAGSIAEKALMMKIAGEMARRMTDERILREKAEEMFDEERMRARKTDSPPPAYKA